MSETQAWLFLTVTVASFMGVAFGVWLGRRTARQQSTLDFIHGYNNDSRISAGLSIIRCAGGGAQSPANILGQENDRDNLLFLLNKFEILSIGLKREIYDRQMVTDFFGRDIREIYGKSRSLINHIRNTEADGEAFAEFESLADSIRTQTELHR